MKALVIAMQCVTFWHLILGFGNHFAASSYQKPCSNVQIDLQIVLKQAKIIEQKSPRFDEAEIQGIKELL
jgi:hypothetical protein